MKGKKKLKITLTIISLVVLICLFFTYKGYYYLLYRPNNISDHNYNEYMNSFKVNNTFNLTKKNISNSNYLIYKNIKIRNDFSNYTVTYSDENTMVYSLNTEDSSKPKAIFRIGVDNQVIDTILTLFTEKDKEAFLKKYNITNDIELLDFILQKHNTNNTIFTKVSKMKENAMIQYFTYTTLSNPTYVTKITGDYKGYIIGNGKNTTYKNISTAVIIKDNKKYYFGFWLSDNFTEDYIKDILSTVIIEDNDIETFTKTYQVLDITEKEDNSKTYLKLKQYQMEEEVTVEVSNSFAYNLEKDKYYEFTFQKTNNNIEDNISSIFENTNLLSINLSTKEGLDQTQESPK